MANSSGNQIQALLPACNGNQLDTVCLYHISTACSELLLINAKAINAPIILPGWSILFIYKHTSMLYVCALFRRCIRLINFH